MEISPIETSLTMTHTNESIKEIVRGFEGLAVIPHLCTGGAASVGDGANICRELVLSRQPLRSRN